MQEFYLFFEKCKKGLAFFVKKVKINTRSFYLEGGFT